MTEPAKSENPGSKLTFFGLLDSYGYTAVKQLRTVVDLADVTYAILVDVADHGGRLAHRLDEVGANVPGAIKSTRQAIDADGADGGPQLTARSTPSQ